jgi:hypothetical protein
MSIAAPRVFLSLSLSLSHSQSVTLSHKPSHLSVADIDHLVARAVHDEDGRLALGDLPPGHGSGFRVQGLGFRV